MDARRSCGRKRNDQHRETAEGHPQGGDGAEGGGRDDGLLLATPAYNLGIPGAFKNAIDWMSAAPKGISRVFGGKPVGLIGASPGGFGTILAQTARLPVLPKLGCELWPGKLMVSQAGHAFEDGRLVSENTRGHIEKYLVRFAGHLARHG